MALHSSARYYGRVFTAALILLAYISLATAVDNGLGLTPQMGWNTWNRYGCDVSETLVIRSAQAIKNQGLQALGYNYISIDDCWQADARANGTNAPVANAQRFPSGFNNLTATLHNLGFKVGIYSSAGKYTCAGRFGSLGYETIDAQTYANWGFDYLKYDNCFNEGQSGTPLLSYTRYKVMGDALNATNRPIFYSLCQWGKEIELYLWINLTNASPGEDGTWNWATTLANSWRMSGDVYDRFDRPDPRCPCTDSAQYCQLAGYHCSIMNILEKAAGIGQKGRVGSWPDLDGLEVGNGGMTDDEYRVQFSLWALMKSPFLLGTDVTNISDATRAIITNRDIIAVNQDPMGSSGYRIWKQNATSSGSIQLWKGDLSNNTYAMAVLNASPQNQTVTVLMSDFLVDYNASYAAGRFALYDLWQNASLFQNVTGSFSVQVPTHGVRMFKVAAA